MTSQPESGAMTSASSKGRFTVHLPVELMDRARNAVYWTPGLTLARLAEVALKQVIDQLEKTRGKAFGPRRGHLRGGRPVG